VNKIVFLLFVSIFYQSVFAKAVVGQKRATTKKVVVSARDRIVIKTDDFPVGTTVIYRITLWTIIRKLLIIVSLLKAVPDPYRNSQGLRELFSCCLEFQEMIKAGMLFFVK
jgi:hypothetical protein